MPASDWSRCMLLAGMSGALPLCLAQEVHTRRFSGFSNEQLRHFHEPWLTRTLFSTLRLHSRKSAYRHSGHNEFALHTDFS